MIDEARTVVDEDERVKAYLDIQKYLATQVYSIAGNPNGILYTMVQPRVRNYALGDTSSVSTSNWTRRWQTR